MGVSDIVIAILSWFAAQNNSPWFECGKKYTEAEAEKRATYYAQVITEAAVKYPAPDMAKWMLGMLAQESAFDECQFARRAKKRLGLGHRPTKKQILKILKNRKKHKIKRVDTGPFQRMYPPYGDFRYPPEMAIDLKFQTNLTGQWLRAHHKGCMFRNPRGVKIKVGKRRIKLTCDDMYWTYHNTGGSGFGRKYWGGVTYQLGRMTLSEKPEVQASISAPTPSTR